MQKSKIKMQNDKSKFKKDFIVRVINFTISILKLCERLQSRRVLWKITDQIISSAGSIGANVVEAKASSSRLEYKKFFEISLKSANETLYWLIVLKGIVTAEEKVEIEKVYTEALEIAKILAASVLTLKNKR